MRRGFLSRLVAKTIYRNLEARVSTCRPELERRIKSKACRDSGGARKLAKGCPEGRADGREQSGASPLDLLASRSLGEDWRNDAGIWNPCPNYRSSAEPDFLPKKL